MFCEQCGNEFHKSKSFKIDDKEYVRCPFCGYKNEKEPTKRKNRRDSSREKWQ